MDLQDIIAKVRLFNTPYVTVTGGEPMAQKNCIELLRQLCDEGFRVSLETSGALDLANVDKRVTKVMDLKTPGSGEQGRNLMSNIALLGKTDQVKFVLRDREDYDWAKDVMVKYGLTDRCEILMSPAYGELDIKALAGWILQDHLAVRLQTQLHKLIWGNERGR